GCRLLAMEGGDCGLQTVATFTDPGGPEPVSDYSATINWGDGISSAATTVANPCGSSAVRGRHTYAEEGAYTLAVAVAHDSAPTVTVVGSATVSDPAVVATGGFRLIALEGGDSGLQTVATFTDPGGPEP